GNIPAVVDVKTAEIKGKVVNEEGEAMPGVTVIVRLADSTFHTVTDGDGLFRFGIPSSNGTLVFRYVGYEEYRLPLNTIKSGRVFTVTLKRQTVALDDVVVIGYGQINRRDATGALASVDVKAMSKAPVKS